MSGMMTPAQRERHMSLVREGLRQNRASLTAELAEQRSKLERSVRLAGKDMTWGRKEFADAAAEKIQQLLVQLKAVDDRIQAEGA